MVVGMLQRNAFSRVLRGHVSQVATSVALPLPFGGSTVSCMGVSRAMPQLGISSLFERRRSFAASSSSSSARDITHDTVENMLREAGVQLTRGEVKEVIHRLDDNKDGQICVEEIEAWYRREEEKEIALKRTMRFRQFVESYDRKPMLFLTALDFGGSGVFAISGAMLAADSGMNLLGCMLVGSVTAVGGGTVSNVLYGTTPVFWIRDPRFLVTVLGCSSLTFLVWQLLHSPDTAPANDSIIWCFFGADFDNAMFWCDTAGLAAFSIIGAQHGLRAGAHPLVCCAGGVIIVMGGVIRDVLCNRNIALGGKDPYASSALLGATVYTFTRVFSVLTLLPRILFAWFIVVADRAAYFFKLPWLISLHETLQPARK